MQNTNLQKNSSTAERILYAAMQIISESGLKGLSASKLASAANISKSTVFHYFKKMDEIPGLVLEKLYTEIINPIQEKDHSSVYVYLKALGEASFSSNEQHLLIYKAFVSLFQASMHDPQLQKIVNNCSDEFNVLLYNKLRSLCHNPIDEDILNKVCHLIFMSLDGIGLHYLIHGDHNKALAAWELLITALTNQYALD